MILILLRHGKSSWKNPNLNDFDRPLGKRGIKELPIVMDHFSNYIIENTKVICSSSLRTMQTYNIVKDFMPSHETVFLKDLYHASKNKIIEIINDNLFIKSLMVIGHNPGLNETLHFILKEKYLNENTFHFPTSAIAVIKFKKSINKIQNGNGKLLDFIKFKNLKLNEKLNEKFY